MAAEELNSGTEIINATQNAVIEAADNVAALIEQTAEELHGHGEAFYEHPTFWVGVSFMLVILLLGPVIAKAFKGLMNKRIEGIINRIKNASQLQDDAQKLLVEYETKAVNAGKEANRILKKSRNEIELIKKETLDKLKIDMKNKEKEAAARLENAQKDAVEEIAALTTELTMKTVRLAIAEALNDNEQDKLIDKSIEKISKLK